MYIKLDKVKLNRLEYFGMIISLKTDNLYIIPVDNIIITEENLNIYIDAYNERN